MVASREEAYANAVSQIGKSNKVGTCQLWTRTQFEANSVGDVDGDGDADAVDGWKAEPSNYKHTDRKPPRGVPVAWSGGSKGFGHRAISAGPDANGVVHIISTDAPVSGKVGVVPLDWFERNWGMNYLGWSDTISKVLIDHKEPVKPTPAPTKKTKYSWRVARAIKLLESEQRHSKLPSNYRDFVRNAVAAAKKIPFVK